MLLNAPLNLMTPAPPSDADAVRAALAPVAPVSGRALLAELERMAQAELAVMVDEAAATPRPDPALAWLGWEMGLSGADIAGAESPIVT